METSKIIYNFLGSKLVNTPNTTQEWIKIAKLSTVAGTFQMPMGRWIVDEEIFNSQEVQDLTILII